MSDLEQHALHLHNKGQSKIAMKMLVTLANVPSVANDVVLLPKIQGELSAISDSLHKAKSDDFSMKVLGDEISSCDHDTVNELFS